MTYAFDLALIVPTNGANVDDALVVSALSPTQTEWLPTTGLGPQPSNANPSMNGVAAPGVAALFARADHVHPVDASRYAATNPAGYQSAAQVTASLAAYMPLTGGAFTGGVSFTIGAIFASPANINIGGGVAGQVLASLGGQQVQWANPGIADAPSDGKLYGRENATWTEVTVGGGGITDAPSNGVVYARLDAAWTPALAADADLDAGAYP